MKKIFLCINIFAASFSSLICEKYAKSEFYVDGVDEEVLLKNDISSNSKTYPFYEKIPTGDSYTLKRNYFEPTYKETGSLWWKKYYKTEYYKVLGYDVYVYLAQLTPSALYDSSNSSGMTISVTNTITVEETDSYSTSVNLGFDCKMEDKGFSLGLSRTHSQSITYSSSLSSTVSYTLDSNDQTGWYSIQSILTAEVIMCKISSKTNKKAEYSFDHRSFFLNYYSEVPGTILYRTDKQH
ncbi:MAG: hypothetical protein IKP12_05250 [Acholeplasmatales bacterium]|nr:hypothetical protein [Acholeplasmatales bacterium]